VFILTAAIIIQHTVIDTDMDTVIDWTDEMVKQEEGFDDLCGFGDDDIKSLEFLPEWKEFVEAEVWNGMFPEYRVTREEA
jgi:hypothetical protein